MSAERCIDPVDGPLDADVAVPGSKSIANRALLCAALAEGASTIVGVPDGDDSMALTHCLTRLGLSVTVDDTTPRGDTLVVVGGRHLLRRGEVTLDARLAGTTSRFVTALAALAEGPVTIDGDEPLRRRPMHALHDALRTLGADVRHGRTAGHLPVVVRRHLLRGGAVSMPGDVSSQFVTALMLIAPCLDGGVEIELTTPLVSRPYVAITAEVMRAFGVTDIDVGDHHVRVGAGSYRPTTYQVEADASSASYPLAAAAIAGGRVRVDGVGRHALQGDAAFADLLGRMGCTVGRGDDWTEVHRGERALEGLGAIDMADMSDLVPTLAVVAAMATTPTRITGVGFIRAKESDRIGDLVAELRRLGVNALEHDDGLEVGPSSPKGATVATHHDHRLAMSLSLLGLVVPGVVVADPEVVTKSWPAWWQTLEALGR